MLITAKRLTLTGAFIMAALGAGVPGAAADTERPLVVCNGSTSLPCGPGTETGVGTVAPSAPALTSAQLTQLQTITTWIISYRETDTYSFSGRGTGGDLACTVDECGYGAGAWSQTYSDAESDGGSFVVIGPAGCVYAGLTGGCQPDRRAPANAAYNLNFVENEDAELTTGLPPPNCNGTEQSVKETQSVSGTRSFGPGHPIPSGLGPFYLNYSTNPPRDESDVGGIPFTGKQTNVSVGCLDHENLTKKLTKPFWDASFYYNTDPTDYGSGGDTQVRVQRGQFVVTGSATDTFSFGGCVGVLLQCFQDPTGHFLASKGTWTASRTATAVMPKAPKPAVTSFKAAPSTLRAAGGTVALTASAKHATSCAFSVSPAVPGLPATLACSSGTGSTKVSLPRNSSAAAVTYTFGLEATGPGGWALAKPVRVTVFPRPSIASFKAAPSTLRARGGSVALTAWVRHATRCTFSASPAVAGLPATVACSSGTGSTRVTLPKNSSVKAVTYTFRLKASGQGGTTAAKPIKVTVARK
jgi:hypothetical protein